MAIESDVSEQEVLTADEPVFEAIAETETVGIADDIGLRLKCIRERNGLSQRELAKRAGITNSNISMIEQGLVSPSINSLARVLSGIPMTLAQFFACNPLDIGKVIYTADTLASTANVIETGIVQETVAHDKNDRALNMKREVYLPNADTGRQLLYADSELTGILVFGSLELTAGTLVRQLFAGDAFYLVAGQPYRFRNVSASNAELITSAPLNVKSD